MFKKKKTKIFVAILLLFLGVVRFSWAAVPTVVNYQGRLSDAANSPLSGQYDFRFRLYDDAAKTNLLWGPEEHLNKTVDNGYVSVQLGSIESFEAAGLDFTDQYWLTIQIKENSAGTWDDETDPPVEFSSYSYALNSEKVVSPTGEVDVGETIQGGAGLTGTETAFNINTGSGFSGDLLSLSNNSTNYLTVDSLGDAYFSNMQSITMENNSVNNLIGLKVINTNDADNYAGSILELKGSGADYTNNVYFGKYGDGFWVPSWAGNGVLATDQDLILGSMGSSDATNPNADPRILFQVGGGYSTPITTAIMESDGLELLPYDTVAGATSGIRFRELAANGSNYISLQSSDSLVADLNFVLPDNYGSNGEVLITDGTGGLSWGAAAAPTVANGLYNDAGTIKLGGDLTETTYINHMGYDLVVREFAGEPATYFAGDNFKIEDSSNDRVTRFGSSGVDYAGISFESSTNEHNIYYRDDALHITSDNLAFSGLQYAADYSANYTDRSLVDRAYVDSHVGSSIYDADSDTGIQVERTADDDNIYFQSMGQDIMRLVNAGGTSKNIYIGDYSGDGNETKLEISDVGNSISFNGFVASIGDIEGNGNETYLYLNDANQRVDITHGNLRLVSGGAGTGELHFADFDGTPNYVGFVAPSTLTADQIWTLPNADGSNGQFLSTDGSGQLSWSTASGGSATVTSVDLTTATTDGNFTSGAFVGYEAANDMCAAEYTGSHFCRTDEIISYIASSGASGFTSGTTAWIAEGPPGYTSNSNDCNGWTDNDATKLGAFWEFSTTGGGMGWLTNCGVSKPVACCQ